MSVAKAVVRGILIASLACTTTRAGAILYLGVTSSDAPPPPIATAPTSGPAPFAPSSPAPSLQLGVFSATGGVSSPAPTPFVPPSAIAPSPPTSNLPAAPAPATTFAPSPPPASGVYNAFINLGQGPYPNAAGLSTGNPQPWYVGSGVDRLFGGIPSIPQAAAFDATVLQRVQQTFALSGIPISLTNDPTVPAAHTISVVSQTSNPAMASALGMTYLGGNGFQYIDTAASATTSVDQLEWIVAHNLAHELMLAFGVPELHDQSGRFVDTPTASWAMMTSPTATFSPGAVADLLSKDFQATGGAGLNPSAQQLGPPTVPEPSTMLLWAAIVSAGLAGGRARRGSGGSNGRVDAYVDPIRPDLGD